MSATHFSSKIEKLHRDEDTKYTQGFMVGYVQGCARAKKIYFPKHLPKELDNDTYVETKYGENQENVWTEYAGICEGEDDCGFTIGILLSNIKDAVDLYLDPDPPSADNITEKDVLQYFRRIKQVNCIKKELINFALHIMKLRHKSVFKMGKCSSKASKCKLSSSLSDDVKTFNKVIANVDAYYKHNSGISIDEETFRLEY